MIKTYFIKLIAVYICDSYLATELCFKRDETLLPNEHINNAGLLMFLKTFAFESFVKQDSHH